MESRELERFEAVVLPHLDAAYTLARYLTRNAHDAEDVVQDACLRAIRHFESFSGEEATSARAWLLAIVRNTAYSARRRHRAEDVATEFDEKSHSDTVADEHPEAALLRSAAKESLARAGYHLLHWTTGDYAYWAVSDLGLPELEDFAGLLRKADGAANAPN